MGTFNTYKTNQAKEEQGTPVVMADGSTVYVARINSKRVQNTHQAARKPYQQAINKSNRLGQKLDESIENEIALQTTINGIIVDWEGVTDENDKELPFNKENARYVLENLPEFHTDIVDASQNISNFVDNEDEEAGNA